MPDTERTPVHELHGELVNLGSRIVYPPTPDLARAVRYRLEQEDGDPVTHQGRSRFFTSRFRWAVVATMLVVLIAAPVLFQTLRDPASGLSVGGQGAGGAGGEAQPDGDVAVSGQEAGRAASGARSEAGARAPGAADEVEDGGFDRKVIKTAELGIRAEDVRSTAARAQQMSAEAGGNTLSSRVNRGDGTVSAEVVLSVPADAFEDVLDELRGMGEVTNDAVGGEDVTEEFVDLESRERNLLAAERGLLKLYDEAEDVEDALSIQRELTDVRGQVERVQGRIQYLEQRTDFSRIDLSVQPVPAAKVSGADWEPGRAVARAWSASLLVLQTIGTAALSAVVFGWWLAPLFVIGLLWWRRRSRAPGPNTADSS